MQDSLQAAFALVLRRGDALVDEIAAPATGGSDHAQPARDLSVIVAEVETNHRVRIEGTFLVMDGCVQ